MTIINRTDVVYRKKQIDLSGPEGNAFVLLATCKTIAKQLNMDWKSIQESATSGDYDHLVQVLDEHFGNHIDFIK